MGAAIDRRGFKRQNRPDEHGIDGVRVRPGHEAAIVDVSAGGALIETAYRLLPGAAVELHLSSGGQRASIRGRVVRCAVARLRASRVWYRGAIAFEQSLPWLAEPVGRQEVHGCDMRAPGSPRGDATPHLV